MQKNQKSLKEQYIEMQQNAFIREVNEDVRNQKIFSIWNKYKFYIIFIIIAILTFTISKNIYEAHKKNISLQQALQIEKIMSDSSSINDKMLNLSNFAKDAKFGYKDIAYFNLYSLQIQNNNINDAISTLNNIIDDASDSSFQNLAILKLANLSIADKNLDENQKNRIIDLLSSISSSEPFYFSAQYVLGVIYLSQNNLIEAKNIFSSISENENAPIGIKSESLNMLNFLKSKSVK